MKTHDQRIIAWEKLKVEQARAWATYKEVCNRYGKSSVDAAQAIQYWNGITTAITIFRGIGDYN